MVSLWASTCRERKLGRKDAVISRSLQVSTQKRKRLVLYNSVSYLSLRLRGEGNV